MRPSQYAIPVLLTCLLLLVPACSREDEKTGQQAPKPPPPRVEVITVNNAPVPVWFEFTGRTEAGSRVEVRARVAGRLEQRFFTDGEYVKAGDLLFAIEKGEYQAAVDAAQAQLERDQASLALAQADVDRYRPLVAKQLAPRASLEQYIARRNELMATIKMDEARLREARLKLGYCEVRAPIDGRVSRRFVDVGNMVGQGEQTLLTVIVSDDPIYAYFNPSEEQFQVMRKFRSRETLDARVRLPQGNGLVERPPFEGVVDFGDNRIDPATGTITMRARVPNPRHDLMEGTFVYVEVFVTDQVPFMAVPPAAVLEDQQGSYVFVVDNSGHARRRDVERGFESRYFIVIGKGLQVGDRVAVSAMATLSDGQQVDPRDVTATRGLQAMAARDRAGKAASGAAPDRGPGGAGRNAPAAAAPASGPPASSPPASTGPAADSSASQEAR